MENLNRDIAAERNGMVATGEVGEWIRRADVFANKDDEEVENHNENNRYFGELCLNCLSNYKSGRCATKKRIEVVPHIDRANFSRLAADTLPPLGREMPSTPITGQYTFMENVRTVLEDINNDEFGTIGIHGQDS
ncbi:hypothetical protein AMTRI_Chr02g214650 [Amborella trichopoda]